MFITNHPSNKKNLENIHCDHYIAGINYLLTPNTRITFEIYHKNYFNYPVSADDGYEMISMANSGAEYGNSSNSIKLVSEGEGKADGLEFMIQKKLAEKLVYCIQMI